MKHYIVTVPDDVSDADLAAQLELMPRERGDAPGLPAPVEVSDPHRGIALTERQLEAVWSYETGRDYCDGRCAGRERRHRHYLSLTPAQRRVFARRLCDFLNQARYDEYLAQENLSAADFPGIALGDCADDE